jgi:hypothetical protein
MVLSVLATLKPRFVVFVAANDPFDEAIFDTDASVTCPIHDIGFDGKACVTVFVVLDKVFVTNTAPTTTTPNDTTAVRVTTRLVPNDTTAVRVTTRLVPTMPRPLSDRRKFMS